MAVGCADRLTTPSLSCGPPVSGAYLSWRVAQVLLREDLPVIFVGVGIIFLTMYFYSGSLFFTSLAFLQVRRALRSRCQV